MPETRCDRDDREARAARYVAGRLSAAATEAFEAHYLECTDCQAAIVLAEAARGALAEGERGVGSPRRKLAWGLAGLAAAAVIATILLPPFGGDRDAFSDLGRVETPPIYLPVPVRAAPAPADSLFDAAMAAYDRSEYEAAAAGLETALEAGVDPEPAAFFLGASRLLSDRPERAVAAFERVTRSGDTAYAPEARYYLGKALLRLGRPDAAVDHLRAIAASDHPMADPAGALADSVEARIRR